MSTFNQPAAIPEASLAKSAHINDLSSAIKSAFDALPNETKLALETVNYFVATGTVNTYAVTVPGITSYVDGMKLVINVPVDNAGLSTINVNGLGPIEIRSLDSVSLSTGVLKSGIPTEIRYSSATGYFHVFVQASAPITGSLLIVNALAELGALAETARINIGLGSVNNTSDANKPISTATQNALNLKLDLSTLPTLNSANAGKYLALNQAGTGYDVISPNYHPFVLNGNFSVWQAGATLTDPTSPLNMYAADGWACFRVGWTPGITVTQSAGGIKVQRNSGDTNTASMVCSQSFETDDVKTLQGKTVTLQFKMLKGSHFSEATSKINLQVLYGTGTDGNLSSGFFNQAVLTTTGYSLTTTKTLFACTFTIPINATQLGFQLYYTPANTNPAGADDSFSLFSVHLNEGNIPELFPLLLYGSTLRRCKRYYRSMQLWVGTSTAKTVIPIDMRSTPVLSGGGTGFDSSNTSADALICFQTTAAVQTIVMNARL